MLINFNSQSERKATIKKIIFWSIIFGGLLALFFGQTNILAIAQQEPINVCGLGGGDNCLEGTENAKGGSTGISTIIINIATFFIYIGSAVAIFFIILGGYMMITSNGNEDRYTSGLKSLRNAIVGLILAIMSLTIIALTGNTVVGLDILI